MKIIQKMKERASDRHQEGVTIAFLGDSVTQGCFEIYRKPGTEGIVTVYDKRHSYEQYLFDIFATLFPTVPLNIINAGIAGDKAFRGVNRVERDVIRHQPDLAVVCYGLNDCKLEDLPLYISSLEGIFTRLKEAGIETIFMTPNMMNTRISSTITDPVILEIAEKCQRMQNEGIFDAHIEAARELCKKQGIPVCDCYALWKTLAANGVDTTELLSNKANHPTREMNRLFAIELTRTMFTED